MISLGIESSAYALGIGVVDEKGRILSNVRISYKPRPGEGLIPREAAEFYSKNVGKILKEALDRANLSIRDVDIISVTIGPGIGLLLRIGTTLARYLSIKYNKEIVGVNHGIAHIEIARLLTGFKDPVILYVSGGNTQVISYKSGRYRVFGETLDIGVGNFLDTIARELRLDMPGGKKIEELAKKGNNYIDMPYVVKGMDVSLTGLQTYILNLIRSKKYKVEDICYSLQETVFSMLLEISERAIYHLNKDEFLIVGGVASNERLNEMAEVMAKENGIKFKKVPKEFLIDNGAMVAWTGLLMYKSGYRFKVDEIAPKQRFRVEDVEVRWIRAG